VSDAARVGSFRRKEVYPRHQQTASPKLQYIAATLSRWLCQVLCFDGDNWSDCRAFVVCYTRSTYTRRGMSASTPPQVDASRSHMSFQRALSPAQWAARAQAAKEAAGWRCAGCGALHGSLAVSQHNRFYRVILAACHLQHAIGLMTQPTQSRGSPCTAKRVTCATTPSTTGELVDAICGHNALRQDNWNLCRKRLTPSCLPVGAKSATDGQHTSWHEGVGAHLRRTHHRGALPRHAHLPRARRSCRTTGLSTAQVLAADLARHGGARHQQSTAISRARSGSERPS
jgi:hypothetical protein